MDNGLNRREFLGRSGATLGGLALTPSLLSMLGDARPEAGGKSIRISTWSGYIDIGPNKSKLIKKFENETGIKVTYTEDVNDNDEYFAKIRPSLARKQSINRDGFVLTDWMANRIINQVHWAKPFVTSKFPNLKNLRKELTSVTFDLKRKNSAPWTSGITGIAYNLDSTGGKEIRTIEDFLAVEGTKTVLTEMRDTVGLFMLANGEDTVKPSYAKAQKAFDALEEASSSGRIKGFNGNDYTSDLSAGNLAAAFAWSGDVAQITLDNPSIKFAVPDSGGMLWSDNFMIPFTSSKAALATEWINFFYDPVNAAELNADIQFISPVEGANEELRKMGGAAAALASNPLVAPTPEFLQGVRVFGPLNAKEERKFNNRFSQILGSG